MALSKVIDIDKWVLILVSKSFTFGSMQIFSVLAIINLFAIISGIWRDCHNLYINGRTEGSRVDRLHSSGSYVQRCDWIDLEGTEQRASRRL